MTLRTGEIKEEDFYLDRPCAIGWALIAPHLVLRVDTDRRPFMESWFALYLLVDPLGFDLPMTFDAWVSLPGRRGVTAPVQLQRDSGKPGTVHKLVAWGRSKSLTQLARRSYRM